MARTIRVLHVQHSLEPGGMENGVVNVANALTPLGYDFHVCCLESSGAFAERLPKPQNVHVLGKGEGFSIRTAWRLCLLVRKLKPDVVHSHNLGALIYAALATVGGSLRPILHGEHGQPDEGRDAERRSRQRKWLFRAAKKVHTVSFALRDYFVRQGYSEGKILAFVNGVDTERFAPGDQGRTRAMLELSVSDNVMVIVGRLIESKGHRLLFDALALVLDHLPDTYLLVVGGGGADEAEIRSAALGSPASRHIRMVGFKEDPRPYYIAADLLVSPSTIEGLSNVVLEAMACGVPGLLHDACGTRDVIRHDYDGLMAELTDAGVIAGILTDLFKDKARLKVLGDCARRTVVDRFGLDRMADSYADAYRLLAERRVSRSPQGE